MPTSSECLLDTGDEAWMILSFVLVLFMFPALVLFQAGLLRAKHSLSIVAQVFAGLSILTLSWYAFGYSLVFGPSQGGLIGNLSHAFYVGVDYDKCAPQYSSTVSHGIFAMFEMTFACITPLLMTGAYAERTKFSASLLITCLWEFFVYYPLAHWVWGDGGWLKSLGVQDFAGGIVIHTSAGAGALVLSRMVGRRRDFDEHHGDATPSSVVLAATGAAFLWVGWFGFNGGSALNVGENAMSALVATQISAATSSCVWLFCGWWSGRPKVTAILNGAVAGLAGVTPASGYLSAHMALLLGICLGLASQRAPHLIKGRLRIDDALDVSAVHGLTGAIGSLFIGFGASTRFGSVMDGLFFGGGFKLFGLQAAAVLVTLLWAGGMSYVIAKVVDRAVGLRVSPEMELRGLDISEHDEVAYNGLEVSTGIIQPVSAVTKARKRAVAAASSSKAAHKHQQKQQHHRPLSAAEVNDDVDDGPVHLPKPNHHKHKALSNAVGVAEYDQLDEDVRQSAAAIAAANAAVRVDIHGHDDSRDQDHSDDVDEDEEAEEEDEEPEVEVEQDDSDQSTDSRRSKRSQGSGESRHGDVEEDENEHQHRDRKSKNLGQQSQAQQQQQQHRKRVHPKPQQQHVSLTVADEDDDRQSMLHPSSRSRVKDHHHDHDDRVSALSAVPKLQVWSKISPRPQHPPQHSHSSSASASASHRPSHRSAPSLAAEDSAHSDSGSSVVCSPSSGSILSPEEVYGSIDSDATATPLSAPPSQQHPHQHGHSAAAALSAVSFTPFPASSAAPSLKPHHHDYHSNSQHAGSDLQSP